MFVYFELFIGGALKSQKYAQVLFILVF